MISENSLEIESEAYDSDVNILKDKLRFNNKTLKEWAIELSIKIPEDPDMDDIRLISQELDRCFAVAHNNFIVADGIKEFRNRTLEVERLNAFSDLENEQVKRTLADKDKLVEIKTKEFKDKVVIAKFISEFWHEQVEILGRRQKILEGIFWAIKNRDDHGG